MSGTTDSTSASASSTAPNGSTGAFDPFGTTGQAVAAGGQSSSQVVPPGAAESAYQYETYVSGIQVAIGNNIAQMLGIQPGTYAASDLYHYMSDLPQARLAEFQAFLYSAGFYTDSSGHPLTGMTFGSLDNQSFMALATAVTTAANAGDTLDDAASKRIGSGAAVQARTSLPQAVAGGGNTYNIDLSNPEDVRLAANQIFQAALGRNAKDSEISSITTSLRGQETSQGLAKEQGSEAASRARYQTEVNQRNIAYNFQYAPKGALGALPNGPIASPGQAATSLLQYMGMPVTASNVQFLIAMSNASGGNGMNLWAIQGATPGATVGQNGKVQFSSWAQAFQATAQTLLQYQGIAGALYSGNATGYTSDPTIQAELKKWGAGSGDISKQASSNSIAKQAEVAINSIQTQQPNDSSTYQPSPADARMAQEGGTVMAPGGGSPADARMAQEATDIPGSGGATTVPANDVQPGQITANPGDTYIAPTTVYSVNPASESAAAYNEATTGANRIEFGANNYLNAYQAVVNMIKNGGPTS